MSARHVKLSRGLARGSAGMWSFALSENGAKPNPGKDSGIKLLDTSVTLFIDTSVDALSENQVVHSCFGDNSCLARFLGDQGPAVGYSRIVKGSRALEKKCTSDLLLRE